jgi:4-hydroxybenzoate polyprenyltransferase
LANTTLQHNFTGLARLKLFMALSRTPHGLLDMTTPAFGALLWLSTFPPAPTIILGIITVFAGYTAVYALNDVIDYRVDREKVRMAGGLRESENYLDAIMVRHPIAQGLLSFREGLFWALGWAAVALVGAYILNPICVLIFLAGCVLEAVYCLMLRISPFRTIISGGVKTSGAVAAVFAVDPNPSLLYVVALFFWLFFWEIGGQNIPADWADIEEDRQLRAQTIPVRFGSQGASAIVLWTICIALVLNLVMIQFSGVEPKLPLAIASLIAGGVLLLPPTFQLYRTAERRWAMALFNRASYYPVVMLVLIVVKILL